MSRPKSGGAPRPPSQGAPQPAGEPRVRVDNKRNGVPQDALKQAVFDKPKVAKKVFQSMDKDKDKKLSHDEFTNGFKELLTEEGTSSQAIEALWNQTDTNLDGFVSWDEFRLRFCVDLARNFDLRQELTPLDGKQKTILTGIRSYIHLMYDTSEAAKTQKKADETWQGLGFDESTKFNAKVLRGLCETFGAEEKKQADAKSAAPPKWIQCFSDMSKDEVAELLLEVETKNNGLVHLPRYDKRLGRVVELPITNVLNYKRRLTEMKVKGKKGSKKESQAPSTADRAKTPAGRKGGKAPKSASAKAVTLKSIASNLIQEWLAHDVFVHVQKARPELKTRVAPSLNNWNINERMKWGLEHSDGTRCYIFLSDSFELKTMIRSEDKLVVIYATYRVELNGLHTFEWLYHCKIYLDKHEEVRDIESRAIQCYKSGLDYALPRTNKRDFRDWMDHVHVPDVFMPSVPPREY